MSVLSFSARFVHCTGNRQSSLPLWLIIVSVLSFSVHFVHCTGNRQSSLLLWVIIVSVLSFSVRSVHCTGMERYIEQVETVVKMALQVTLGPVSILPHVVLQPPRHSYH